MQAPVIKNKTVFKSREITWPKKCDDGIYNIQMGDKPKLLSVPSAIQLEKFYNLLPIFRGISYGEMIIPLNCDQAKFMGYKSWSTPLGMNCEMGMIVKCRRWEQGTLLFHEIDMGSSQQLVMMEVKRRAEENIKLGDYKHVTPEMRHFYLLLSLDVQRISEWRDLDKLELGKEERDRRITMFKESFAGRLEDVVSKAGGTLVKFHKRGTDMIELTWTLDGKTFNTIIKQDFSVLELGFCATGEDKKHSMSSAIAMARQFLDEGLLYRTRV